MWIQVVEKRKTKSKSYVNLNTGMFLCATQDWPNDQSGPSPCIISCKNPEEDSVYTKIYVGEPVITVLGEEVSSVDNAIKKANLELDRLVLRLNGGLQHTWS